MANALRCGTPLQPTAVGPSLDGLHGGSPRDLLHDAVSGDSPRGVHRTLRKSCDACKDAKVKCEGHGKPCPRCLTRGIYCRYGWSNRGHGKRAATDVDRPVRSPTPSCDVESASNPPKPNIDNNNNSNNNNNTTTAFYLPAVHSANAPFPLAAGTIPSPLNPPPPCDCFASLLRALQALETPMAPADPNHAYTNLLILSLTKPAVDVCERTLSCAKCTAPAPAPAPAPWTPSSPPPCPSPSTPTTAVPTTLMLLATVLGKLGSLYTAAAAALTPSSSAPAEREALRRRERQSVFAPHLARFEAVCDMFDRACAHPAYEGGVAASLVIFLRGHLLCLAGLCDWRAVCADADAGAVGLERG